MFVLIVRSLLLFLLYYLTSLLLQAPEVTQAAVSLNIGATFVARQDTEDLHKQTCLAQECFATELLSISLTG